MLDSHVRARGRQHFFSRLLNVWRPRSTTTPTISFSCPSLLAPCTGCVSGSDILYCHDRVRVSFSGYDPPHLLFEYQQLTLEEKIIPESIKHKCGNWYCDVLENEAGLKRSRYPKCEHKKHCAAQRFWYLLPFRRPCLFIGVSEFESRTFGFKVTVKKLLPNYPSPPNYLNVLPTKALKCSQRSQHSDRESGVTSGT